MISLDQERETDLHYSSVVSLARGDSVKLKEMTIACLEQVNALVRESPAEEIHSFKMDFFSL